MSSRYSNVRHCYKLFISGIHHLIFLDLGWQWSLKPWKAKPCLRENYCTRKKTLESMSPPSPFLMPIWLLPAFHCLLPRDLSLRVPVIPMFYVLGSAPVTSPSLSSVLYARGCYLLPKQFSFGFHLIGSLLPHWPIPPRLPCWLCLLSPL